MTDDLIVTADFRGHFYAIHFRPDQKREACRRVAAWSLETPLDLMEGELIAEHIDAACHCAEAEERFLVSKR